MNDKFIAGNCVGLIPEKPPYRMNNQERLRYMSSWHILNQKDIDRGYFYAGSGFSSFDLTLCEYKNPASNNLITRCSTLRGKSIQPVSIYKYMHNVHNLDAISVTTYLMFKGNKIKVKGYYHNGQFFFNGFGNEFYKAKVYVDPEGYLVGRSVYSLSPQQLCKCFNVYQDGKL